MIQRNAVKIIYITQIYMYIFLHKYIQQYYMKINNYNPHNFSPFIRNMKKKIFEIHCNISITEFGRDLLWNKSKSK